MLEIIKDIFTNHVVLAPVFAWLICQFIKIIINIIVDRKFTFERLFGDGGMPSGHSATVSCLFVMVGWTAGFDSPMFAIAGVLAMIVMHDATGVRREAGKQAVSIKELAEAINKAFLSHDNAIKTQNLKVLVGHTPLQVFFGALVGVLFAISYILLFLR